MMLATTRSEMTRLWRRSYLLGWLGITALFSVFLNVFVFTSASDGAQSSAAGPGGAFPSVADLARSGGLVGGLGAAATLLGVVTLSFWAIAAANDYSTGLIRLLVQAQPLRVRLVGGKALALTVWTAAAATIATVLSTATALAMAGSSGISTAAWGTDPVATIAGAWTNTVMALLVWGAIGLVIAVIARSSAVAIAVGVGYVLVLESVVRLAAENIADWLPGSTLTALAKGGSAAVSYHTAIGLGLAYALVGLGVACYVFTKRDITD
jgi:ABC-2 type transport system permease protein